MAGMFDDLDDVNFNEITTKEQIKAEEIQKNAHMANGGDAQFDCPSCRGKGYIVIGYVNRRNASCFKCKGKGKVSKRVLGAMKAKVTRENNLNAKRDQFIAEHADVVEFIRKNASWSNFYMSMNESIEAYGALTENQLAAVEKGMVKAEERRIAKEEEKRANAGDVDVSAINKLFDTARESGLKRLAFRTMEIKISAAKENSRNPGALYVEHDGNYVGKIVEGKFMPTYSAKNNTLEKIKEVADNPLEMAKFYGRQTGVCSCCGRELTDPESVAAGIGPICERNWGF